MLRRTPSPASTTRSTASSPNSAADAAFAVRYAPTATWTSGIVTSVLQLSSVPRTAG
ncbi:hypothetical protein ACIA5G_06865 [Amycolatopsis sp. NPDC051758]|uniref:hypothetical protein n=1 Tax=Amycolatopsis sp. NPDC051758 TaxID=3363935 RepID=UPI00378E2B95